MYDLKDSIRFRLQREINELWNKQTRHRRIISDQKLRKAMFRIVFKILWRSKFGDRTLIKEVCDEKNHDILKIHSNFCSKLF